MWLHRTKSSIRLLLWKPENHLNCYGIIKAKFQSSVFNYRAVEIYLIFLECVTFNTLMNISSFRIHSLLSYLDGIFQFNWREFFLLLVNTPSPYERAPLFIHLFPRCRFIRVSYFLDSIIKIIFSLAVYLCFHQTLPSCRFHIPSGNIIQVLIPTGVNRSHFKP